MDSNPEKKRLATNSSNVSESKRQKSFFEHYKDEYEKTTPWRGNVDAKLNSAAPFHFFLTRIQDERKTYDEDLSITFPELIDPSLGELEHSVHFTFVVEPGWLLAQYAVAGVKKPSVYVYYDNTEDIKELPQFLRDRLVQIDTGDPYGHHHTKMSLFFYKDGSARVVILTANLIQSDWENRTQGVWVSPLLPLMTESATGESITNFKADLLDYLKYYKEDSLNTWIDRLKKVDMSSVMVCFLASVPGTHFGNDYGYRKLRVLLTEHQSKRNPDWNIVAQCSSIGSLGPNARSWLCGPFGKALTGNAQDVPLSLVYPAFSNVKASLDGMLGGACLPYTSSTHAKQIWLNEHFWQWKSDARHRTRAIPHIKTYAQLSPNGKRAGWFIMTSANVSKAAWGGPVSNGLHIRSYEVGVLFLPKFITGEDEFRVRLDGAFNNEEFPFPYDTPLTPYSSRDQPFFYDKCFRST